MSSPDPFLQQQDPSIYAPLQPSGDYVQANAGEGPPPIPQGPLPTTTPPPIDPQKLARQQKMQEWQNLITNFTFSFGSGLEAMAQAPPGSRNRTLAGMGAAFNGPQKLQEILQKNRLQQAQIEAEQMKAKTVPMINPQTGTPFIGPDNQPVMIPAIQQGTNILAQMGIKSKEDIAKEQIDAANARAAAAEKAKQEVADQKESDLLRKDFQRINPITKQREDIPDDELTAAEKETRDSRRAAAALTKSRNEVASAEAALKVQELHGDSESQRLARERRDDAVKAHEDAMRNFNLQYSLNVRKADIEQQRADTAASNAERPTVATRTKAEQADVIIKEGDKLIQEIRAHPDAVGAMNGRMTNFKRNLGIDDSAEAQLYTHLKSFAALQPQLHGSRGLKMQNEFEDAVGSAKQNAAALISSIKSIQGTAQSFQEEGKPKPKSNTTPPAKVPILRRDKPGGPIYEAPQ